MEERRDEKERMKKADIPRKDKSGLGLEMIRKRKDKRKTGRKEN